MVENVSKENYENHVEKDPLWTNTLKYKRKGWIWENYEENSKKENCSINLREILHKCNTEDASDELESTRKVVLEKQKIQDEDIEKIKNSDNEKIKHKESLKIKDDGIDTTTGNDGTLKKKENWLEAARRKSKKTSELEDKKIKEIRKLDKRESDKKIYKLNLMPRSSNKKKNVVKRNDRKIENKNSIKK